MTGPAVRDMPVRLDDGGLLLCPNCNMEYLHQGAVRVFDRDEDAAKVRVAEVSDAVTVREEDSARSDNPSRRRHGLAVGFSCESCGGGLTLTVAQHKGVTQVRWRALMP